MRPGPFRLGRGFALSLFALSGCTTMGSNWMAQPLPGDEESIESPPMSGGSSAPARATQLKTRSIDDDPASPLEAAARAAPAKIEGRVLGTFRNTYYDFPSEADFTGTNVSLKDGRCKAIRDVPRGFFEALCVQGSGTLKSGATVSFSRRDCECAEICPRTSQKICFEELEARRFPWGRGAGGTAITPLLSVATDSAVIALNTPIYIPEYDGLPRDGTQGSFHDGCFIAQDRGLRVKGNHVDVFTGHESVTRLWNQLVPSNKGVTVVLDSPRCARATEATAQAP